MTRAADGIALLRWYPVVQVSSPVNGWYIITLSCGHEQARRACISAPNNAHCRECAPHVPKPLRLNDTDRVLRLRMALDCSRIDLNTGTVDVDAHNARIDTVLRETAT